MIGATPAEVGANHILRRRCDLKHALRTRRVRPVADAVSDLIKAPWLFDHIVQPRKEKA
jgi:hypothetical protein